MPRRQERVITKRTVDALSVEHRDAVFWDRDLQGIDGKEIATREVCLDGKKTTKWPSTRWPITKIMSSDGCNGNRVPLEMGPWYDFREFGCHLGNVG